MKIIQILFQSLILMIIPLSTNAQKNVSTSIVSYSGWEDAVQIENTKIKLVVVPSIGRVMHYSLKGEPNILYVNPKTKGETLRSLGQKNEKGELQWHTFGGDRIWLTEESLFEPLSGYFRPPDHYTDGMAWQYKLLDNGVQMTSPVSQFNGAQLERTITIEQQSTQVKVQQRLIKVRLAHKKELEPIPFTIWNLSKFRNPEQTFFPISKESIYKEGVLPMDWGKPMQYTIKEGYCVFTPKEDQMQKVVGDPRKWLAGIAEGQVLVEYFEFDENGKYPDMGTSIAIFMMNKEFAELECLSPLQELTVGESYSYNLVWDIFKTKGITDQEKRNNAIDHIQNTKVDF